MGRQPSINRTIGQWPAWLNAAVLLVASWIFIAALVFQVRPDAEVVAVVFPPWWSAEQALRAAAAANATFVRTTAIPAILVVRPDEQFGLTRLSDAGAWFAIDPKAIAACLTPEG
jgi:hypothetical protein